MNELSVIVWIIIIFFLDHHFDYSGMIPYYDKPIISIPYNVKCFFNEPLCDYGDLMWGDIFVFISFYILGKVYPGYLKYVLIFSVLYEILLTIIDKPAKLIIGPLIAITGYLAGQL